MAAVRWCPLCQRGDLRRHCPPANRSTVCGWERCPKCVTTFDPVNSRAYDHDGKLLAWPKQWPTGAAA